MADRNLLGITIHQQPDPQEILVQAMSVVAAGGKGVMWFQTLLSEADVSPPRWNAIGDVNWMIRGVRDRLREGDPTGAATSDAKTIVDAIRARDALVIPIISLDTTASPTDTACAIVATEAQVPHWKLASRAAQVTVQVPEDLAMLDVFEIGPGGPADVAHPWSVAGRSVTFAAVPLDNATPVRLLVLAANKGVRAEVAAAMAH